MFKIHGIMIIILFKYLNKKVDNINYKINLNLIICCV